MMRFQSTGRAQVQSVKSCVLYDAGGVIRHMHSVVTMDGADETPDAEVRKRALKTAAGHGVDAKGLEMLHIDPRELDPKMQYRVDVKKRVMKAVPREAARLPSGPARKA